MSNKLRVTFEKGEAMRYVGHLDILRTFVRALRRANVPVKYSEGFTPHAQLTFALPLGVGVTSRCELVDILFQDKIDEKRMVEQVNAVMPKGGIRLIDARWTDAPVPAICRAEYEIEIINGGPVDGEAIKAALTQPELLVEKKSKKQVKTVNLMEHIFEYQLVSVQDNRLTLWLVISAGNTFNIKPTLVIEGLQKAIPTLRPLAVLPHRKRFIVEEEVKKVERN